MRPPIFQVTVLCTLLLSFALSLADEIDLGYSEARPAPHYPREAALHCVEGEVLAGFTVSETLQAENVEILRSTPDGVFEQVVLDALNRWFINAEPGTELERSFEFNLGKNSCPE